MSEKVTISYQLTDVPKELWDDLIGETSKELERITGKHIPPVNTLTVSFEDLGHIDTDSLKNIMSAMIATYLTTQAQMVYDKKTK